MFPRWNAQITVRDFTPLAQRLGRDLGRTVRIETDKDFDSFMRRVYAGLPLWRPITSMHCAC